MKRSIRQTIKVCILALVALGLSVGCTVQLAYNNLDRFVIRWVDDKVNLTNEQRQWVRQALNENLDWHCAEHLPEYAAMLTRINQDIENGGVEINRLAHYSDQVTAFGQELISISIEPATALLASLSDRQVAELFESFDQSNQELIEQLAKPNENEAIQDRTQRMERRLARFMGRLTPEQSGLIQHWSEQYQSTHGHQLAYAYQWQGHLREALRLRHDDPDRFAERIAVLFEPARNWDPGYQNTVEANQRVTLEMVAGLLDSLTPRQQNRLGRKLTGYARDFDALSCQANADLALVN